MEGKDIKTLQKLNNTLSKDSAAAETVRIDDPVNAIEDGLSDFVKHSFKCIEENRLFEKEIQEQISSRLPEANFAQLIKLLEVTNAGNAMDTATLINPFAEAAVARQKAEVEAQRTGAHESQKIYDKASKDILQGLTALNQLLEKTANVVSEED